MLSRSEGRRKPKNRGDVSRTPRCLRNARLLVAAALQHLRDDPALLAIQISRMLPMTLRARAGHILRAAGTVADRSGGMAALGSFMAGEDGLAVEYLERGEQAVSRLRGEVAVLMDRVDLVHENAPVSTRARALWSQGSPSAALDVLESAGRGTGRQARRLRSERQLLDPEFRLPVPLHGGQVTTATAPGEPIRVLHLVTNSLPHTQSGYSVRTHNILTAQQRHGIDSIALTRTGYPVMIGKVLCNDEDEVERIRYRRALPANLSKTPTGRLEQEVAEAMRLVAEFRPHVLHATTDYRNALVAQAVSAATGIPWILEVRGLLEKTWVASHRSEESRARAARSEKARLLIAKESALAQQAAAIVTLSRTMAEELIVRGVSDRSITLVPNGVESALLEANRSPAEARSRLGGLIPADALAVGAVSALVDYEGFDILLRAVASILEDSSVPEHVRRRVHVVLVGDGVSAPSLRALARELDIEERVIMPGRVPREVARVWVQALDVVVVPRRDLEVTRAVTPQKPVEAMALERPVVLSDLPALRETVEATDRQLVGVLVRPDDPEALGVALAQLLADPARRKALAEHGRAVATSRTWEALMSRYEGVYSSVIRAASSSHHCE